MREKLRQAAFFALASLLALSILPVTAKEVRAASYPSFDEISFNGKALSQEVPHGVYYNSLTGILRFDHYENTLGYREAMKVTGSATDLTIEIGDGINRIWSSGIAINAPGCRLTIGGSGSLSLSSTVSSESGDPDFIAVIVANGVTIKDSAQVWLGPTNMSAKYKARTFGIKATGHVKIQDHAVLKDELHCYGSHHGKQADYGISAGGTIEISTDQAVTFSSQKTTNDEDRYALSAMDIKVSNCPEIKATNMSLTEFGSWAPPGYKFSQAVEHDYPVERFTPGSRNYVSVAGSNRFATAVEVAKRAYPYGLPSGEVVIVTGRKFPDALAANAYAGVADAPILLSELDQLRKETKNLLAGEWKGSVSKVTVIGSEFSSGFYKDLKALGFDEGSGSLQKIGGKNRYKTAEAVTERTVQLASQKGIPMDTVAVTTGQNPYDALAFSPWAFRYHIPILLVKDGKASESTKAMIAQFDFVYLLGSEEVCSDSCLSDKHLVYDSYERLAGSNRYKTSQEIANVLIDWFGSGTYDGVGFADGTEEHFPDALAGGMLQGQLGAPIILTAEGSKGEKNVRQWVTDKYAGETSRPYTFYFIGWTAKGKSTEYKDLTKWIESKD